MKTKLKFALIMLGVFALGLITGLWILRGTAIMMDYNFVGCI
ncbi:exported hypothetical protein [Rhodospirillaceae bacterium LM-1]|nr:exported hypothetical protein [Rhodospirillaceae bacterium LM-1]